MRTAKRAVPSPRSSRVSLALLDESDLPLTLVWRNSLRRAFLTTAEISEASHRAWFAQYQASDADFVFVITDIEQLHRPVGQVSIYNVAWQNGTAEYGRLMIGDPAGRGRGLASEATRLIVEWAEAQGIRELTLTVREDNDAAIRLYLRHGWATTSGERGVLSMTRRAPAFKLDR